MQLRDIVDRVRDQPLISLLAVIAGVLVLSIAWSALRPSTPEPNIVVQRVNVHYATVAGLESRLEIKTGGFEGAPLVHTRTISLEHGRMTAMLEDIPSPGGGGLQGLVTPAGNWLTIRGRGCWRDSGGPEVAQQIGIGKSLVPEDAQELSVTRRGDRLLLRGRTHEQGASRRFEFEIDPADWSIVRRTDEVTGVGPQIRSTEVVVRTLPTPPVMPTADVLC